MIDLQDRLGHYITLLQLSVYSLVGDLTLVLSDFYRKQLLNSFC